jgi:hypothetical protein
MAFPPALINIQLMMTDLDLANNGQTKTLFGDFKQHG